MYALYNCKKTYHSIESPRPYGAFDGKFNYEGTGAVVCIGFLEIFRFILIVLLTRTKEPKVKGFLVTDWEGLCIACKSHFHFQLRY